MKASGLIATDLFPNRKQYEALAALWREMHAARRKFRGV